MPELLIVGAIIIVMAAIAVPTIVRNVQTYRLSAAAADVSNMLQLARYEAIRRNSAVSARIAREDDGWVVWVDLNNNGRREETERMILLPPVVQLAEPGDAPPAGSMGFANVTTPWPDAPVTFNFRGQVEFGAETPSVYAIFLWRPAQPDYGFRATTITPAGRLKSWKAAKGGEWQDQ